MQFIGCHLTISKGFTAMGREALALGANTAQFFTRNPRGGKAKELDLSDIDGLKAIMAEHHFGPLIAHAPYTINPCATKPETLEFARQTMADDLRRLEFLPGALYNFHPGSHVGQGSEAAVEKIAETLNQVLNEDTHTTVLLARRWAGRFRSSGISSTGWRCGSAWGCVSTPAMWPTPGMIS